MSLATVARQPCLRASHSSTCAHCDPEFMMKRKSEYFTHLTDNSKDRYESKILACGLKVDPYAIENWTESPEFSPPVDWSDMMLYMVSTPSPHTRESIKAMLQATISNLENSNYYYYIIFNTGLKGHVGWRELS